MKSSKRQQGLGIAGWMFMILLVGGAVTFGMKLIPLYTEHNTMSNILDGVASEAGMANKRTVDIQDLIVNRLKINNIRDFDWKQNMQIKRDAAGVRVILDYEARVPLVANVDLMAKFYKEVELKD